MATLVQIADNGWINLDKVAAIEKREGGGTRVYFRVSEGPHTCVDEYVDLDEDESRKLLA